MERVKCGEAPHLKSGVSLIHRESRRVLFDGREGRGHRFPLCLGELTAFVRLHVRITPPSMGQIPYRFLVNGAPTKAMITNRRPGEGDRSASALISKRAGYLDARAGE